MASKSIVSIAVGICIVCILGIVVSLHIYRENRAADAVLDRADSLLTAGEADAAMSLLDSIRAEAMGYRRSRHYRYRLLEADAMNKTYRPFTTDSILKEVARYYDGWRGTPTKRLRARYLLGCAYRDMKEAPLALIAWEDAVAAADTTETDCGYATLYRIYGQMASIYFRQYMPEKELEARQNLCRYALKAGDTLNYIRGMLKWNDAYLSLHDTVAVLKNTENVRQLYLTRGLTQEAAQVYPSVIQVALDREDYSKADSMMQIFERESGLFDEQGNIAKSRELYYYHKGCYYAGVGLPDSAEYQFRRLLNFEPNLIDAYRGLVSCYLIKDNRDSLFKYSVLYENALVDYLEKTQTQAIEQAEGMYDYSRQQRMVEVQKRKADFLKYAGLLLVLSFIATITVVVRRYRRINREERRKQMKAMATYTEAIQKLAKVKREIGILQRYTSNNDKALEVLRQEKKDLALQYEKEIESLKSELASYKVTQDDVMMKTDIISHFHSIAKPHLEKNESGQSIRVSERKASDDEWAELLEMARLCYPRFYAYIMEHSLPDLRLHVCLLSRLGFDNNEIVALTHSSLRSVTNARIASAKTLFGLNSARDLDKSLREL